MEFLNTLNSLNAAAHHFVISGIICFMRNLILNNKANYLKSGVKHNLWKNSSIKNELKVLDSDMKKITGNTVGSLDDNNLYESLYKISDFVVSGYSHYFDADISDNQKIQELLKGKKDQSLSMWLRFYFRFKGSINEIEKETNDATNYIG